MILQTFLFLLVLINFSSAKLYRNYTLYRTIPVNTDHLKFFENLPIKYDINFWREPGALWKPIEFIISPKDRERFLTDSDKNGIYLTTLDDDVQSIFDKYVPKAYQRSKMETFGWESYYNLEDIYNWLHDLAKNNPDTVSVYSIGVTAEKRQIMAVRIQHNQEKKPAVLIDGGIHAREWISVAFVTYMINEFIERSTDEIKRITSAYEFYIIPVLNPDGYAYSHLEDRLWRKNRNYDGKGVDLNRNFDVVFGKVGASHNITHESYCGPDSFSESESVAFKKLVESLKNRINYYLTFHSYGQAIIIPYLFSEEHADYYDSLEKLGTNAVNRLHKRYQTTYKVGTSFETLGYKASGSSICWVKMNHKVPVSYLFELRDKGRYGFGLLPQYIMPTCEETFDAVLTILDPKAITPNMRNTATSSALSLIRKPTKTGKPILKNKKESKSKTASKHKNKKTTKKKKKVSLHFKKSAHNVELNIYLFSVLFCVKTFVLF